ncbi:hypothetical protein ACGFMK_45315 [Amycolatopsis sp. NPDC049252]|uniref:hypothetical protein n=1 Tax=Amycolatopsis sp. NPDC049252 TaxID=3363933 RepID=UPI00371DF299
MKRILTTTAAVAIALSTLVAPAPAATTTGPRSVGCDPNSQQVRLNVYQRENKFIDAEGGFFDCDMPDKVGYTIQVQLKNVIGWSDKVPRKGSWPRNQLTVTTFTCTGQGTKTYRAQMLGYLGSGEMWVRNSKEIKVKC